MSNEGLEKMGILAKRAAGLPVDRWDVEWWILDHYDVKRVEHVKGNKYVLELNDGQLYEAVWVEGAAPPRVELKIAGHGSQYLDFLVEEDDPEEILPSVG